MPCKHSRSSTGLGPGAFCGHGGSSGSISSHKSSSTIHGRFPTPHELRNRRTGHVLPALLNKIVLRALTSVSEAPDRASSLGEPPSDRGWLCATGGRRGRGRLTEPCVLRHIA